MSGKITTLPRLFSEHSLQLKTNIRYYECTHQLELFDTHFVYFGQILAVSGLKTLVTSDGHYEW